MSSKTYLKESLPMPQGCKIYGFVNPSLIMFIKTYLLRKLFITVAFPQHLWVPAQRNVCIEQKVQSLIVSSNKTTNLCITELPEQIYHSYSCSSTTADRGCGLWIICNCLYTIYIG